jgi:uncharacterized protein YdhG (YjbR/CyaY superfamily)
MKDTAISLPATVDEYISRYPEPVQLQLERLRQVIRKAAPAAEEVISYQIPCYKQDGPLLSFAAFPNHCGLYVINKQIRTDYAAELKGFKTAGTTIQFTTDHPLPAALVKKIVQRRIKENKTLQAEKEQARQLRRNAAKK